MQIITPNGNSKSDVHEWNIAIFTGTTIENGTLTVPTDDLRTWLCSLGMPDGFGADNDHLEIYRDNKGKTGFDAIGVLMTFAYIDVFAARGIAGYAHMLATLLPVIDNIVRFRALALREWDT